MTVETIEEFAESIARFVGKHAELDRINFLAGLPSWDVDAESLMDHIHEITGIAKEKLGYWAEQESNLTS